MAIGDGFAQIVGTAITARQPSSGVEEHVSSVAKAGTTNRVSVYNGSNSVHFMDGDDRTDTASDSAHWNPYLYRGAWMITNSIYLRKDGSTDYAYWSGVQTNV